LQAERSALRGELQLCAEQLVALQQQHEEMRRKGAADVEAQQQQLQGYKAALEQAKAVIRAQKEALGGQLGRGSREGAHERAFSLGSSSSSSSREQGRRGRQLHLAEGLGGRGAATGSWSGGALGERDDAALHDNGRRAAQAQSAAADEVCCVQI
jgi:hypothetical protein